VSVFKIAGIKYYIYLLSDNFSRNILSWKVSEKLSASIRVQTIREAYAIASENSSDLNVDLIVDGGSENNNEAMNSFIEEDQINIHKLIALRDIDFSNSLIEAHFSIIKYRYLYQMNIENKNQLIKAMEFLVHDFNPDYALANLFRL